MGQIASARHEGARLMSIWIGALLAASQIALVALSARLTHAAAKDFADIAPLVGLLSAPAAVGLV